MRFKKLALGGMLVLFIIFNISFQVLAASILSEGDNEDEDSIVYHCSGRDDMKIALTFDDGPHPYYTPEILEILEKYQIKATFFFVGENIKNYPEAASAVRRSGHEIGNHTFTHHRVRAMNHDELLWEMNMCDDAIYEVGEYQTKLFRPPEGAFDEVVEETARYMNYSVVLWSVDTRDWAHSSPDSIFKNVLSNVSGGDIILMHDYVSHNSPTPEALELLIPALKEKGYEFVTVSELIGK